MVTLSSVPEMSWTWLRMVNVPPRRLTRSIVLDVELHRVSGELQVRGDPGAPGVTTRIGNRLLHDAQQRELRLCSERARCA